MKCIPRGFVCMLYMVMQTIGSLCRQHYANVITVPVLPSSASIAVSKDVMMAFLSGFALTNFMAAGTFGSMDPGAN